MSAGLQLSEAVIGVVWWGQLSEEGDGAAAEPQLLLCPCPTSHCWESPLCLHRKQALHGIECIPKSHVFQQCFQDAVISLLLVEEGE